MSWNFRPIAGRDNGSVMWAIVLDISDTVLNLESLACSFPSLNNLCKSIVFPAPHSPKIKNSGLRNVEDEWTVTIERLRKDIVASTTRRATIAAASVVCTLSMRRGVTGHQIYKIWRSRDFDYQTRVSKICFSLSLRVVLLVEISFKLPHYFLLRILRCSLCSLHHRPL